MRGVTHQVRGLWEMCGASEVMVLFSGVRCEEYLSRCVLSLLQCGGGLQCVWCANVEVLLVGLLCVRIDTGW